MSSWDKTETEQAQLAYDNAVSLVVQAIHLLNRARSGLQIARPPFDPPFTRQRAIVEATAKAAQFGELARVGLLSLIRDWEEHERD